MNAEAKTLAARLAKWVVDFSYHPSRPGDTRAIVEAELRADFPEIDRLSAPVEGVGLTRWAFVSPGYYIAAEKARGDGLAKALQPFADALDDIDFADDAIKDNWSIWERPEAMDLTVGHLRAAKRAALSVQPEETNP